VRSLKQLSATEAARGFSDLLDRVERTGESVVVLRHGRPVATIGPPSRGNGKALLDLLRAHRPDPDLVDEVRELREFVGPPQDRWPD
jgi:prevent-host-death family protein